MKKFTKILSIVLIMGLLFSSTVFASDVDASVVDVTAPTGSVELAPGASAPIVITLTVTGKQEGTATFKVYKDWTLSGGTFTGSNPETFTVGPREAQDPANVYPVEGTVTVAAGQAAGTFTLRVGVFDIDNSNQQGAKLGPGARGSYQVIVVSAAPTDTTPPEISYTLTPDEPDGANGWYTGNVFVDWTVVDPQSAITEQTGCDDVTVNYDTAGVTFTCTATSAGGTATQSVTIKRDATAPVISYTLNPEEPNANGWYNSNVTVTWSVSDATSGLADPNVCPQETLADDTDSGKFTCTATDNAGNTASLETVTIKRDATAPVINYTLNPTAPNANGWYKSDVTVTWSVSDATSGLADPNVCPQQTLADDTDSGTFTCTATDNAGNTASKSVTIKLDKTAPEITYTLDPEDPDGLNEWYVTDVTVTWTVTDATSGLADPYVCPQEILEDDTDNGTFTCTATDNAGNTKSVTTDPIKLDKTAPVVTLVGGPADETSYYFGSVPAAPTCLASDATSGLDGECSVSGYKTTVGTHTITATATDKAGNIGYSDTIHYTVLAWTLTGFYQPVDMGIVYNTVKGGSTVPLKFNVFAGEELTDVGVVQSLTYVQFTCGESIPTDEIETTATGGTSLRYDVAGGQFIYNWKTPSQKGVCYRVTMTTDDGSPLIAFFKLK